MNKKHCEILREETCVLQLLSEFCCPTFVSVIKLDQAALKKLSPCFYFYSQPKMCCNALSHKYTMRLNRGSLCPVASNSKVKDIDIVA